MKKHILLGLVAAAFCMGSAKAEMNNWYVKVGASVQGGKDALSALNQDNSYTTCGAYFGAGVDFYVSDNWGVQCEIGTTVMPNRTKRWSATVDGNNGSVELKGNNSIPRGIVAVNYKPSGDISVYGGVGAARTSNKATAHVNGGEVDKLTNNKYEPILVGGVEKRFGNWGGVIEGSYIFNSNKKVNGVKLLSRENNWGINACATYHIGA